MNATTTPWPERLRVLRERLGMTQDEMAQHLMVSETSIRKWEAGRAAPRSGPVVGAIERLEREPTPPAPAEPWSGRVKALRGRVGLTQAEFAAALGMRSQCQISRWEAGTVEPTKRMKMELSRWEMDVAGE